MSALNCEICSKPFGSAAPPRMLPCGHSCCTLCLGSILTATKSCPFCRKVLTLLEEEQYPVNYSIMKICEEISDSPYSMANLQRRLQLLHEKHQTILSFAEDIILKADEHRSEVKEMKKNEIKLLNFLTADNYSFNEVNKNFELIEQTMNNVAKIFSWKGNSAEKIYFKIDSSKFKSYDWTNFLMKIPEGLAINQKFAAVLMVDGVKKFAKLSIYENHLYIHSLETLEDNNDFVTICFQGLLKELLTCTSSKGSIYCFFDLQYRSGVFPRKVIVQVTDPTNYSSSQFLKFCTGELGSSYKGHDYAQRFEAKCLFTEGDAFIKDFIIQTKNLSGINENKTLNGINKDLDIYLKYFSHKEIPRTVMTSNTCYLTCNREGSFAIQRFECSFNVSCPNVIGPIVNFQGDLAATFKNATLRKIIDCGIAFKVDL